MVELATRAHVNATRVTLGSTFFWSNTDQLSSLIVTPSRYRLFFSIRWEKLENNFEALLINLLLEVMYMYIYYKVIEGKTLNILYSVYKKIIYILKNIYIKNIYFD